MDFYTCNNCGRVLVNDRYRLIGSDDYDLCSYDFDQLSRAEQYQFEYALNEHMGGAPAQVEAEVAVEVAVVPATPEEDFVAAMCGIASDSDADSDSESEGSVGSLDDFLDDDDFVAQEEILADACRAALLSEVGVGMTETMDLDEFMSAHVTVDKDFTTMVDADGVVEADWSETDEDEDEACAAEDAMSAASSDDVLDGPVVVREYQRAFGKRQVRAPARFSYPTDWIVNGGAAEYADQ
jgi:hypothetical protein